MNLQEIKQQARQKFSGACRVCPTCNGHACAGEVPGMGGLGDGSSFKNNMEALARWRFNLRTVHSVENPNTRCSLLGIRLAAPILGAAIGGISLNMAGALTEVEYDQSVVDGCRQAGILSMTGDGPHPVVFQSGLKAVAAAGGQGIPIIKPREVNEIVRLADEAASVGALAFGIDSDAAALVNMTNAGQKVGPKTRAELAEIKEKTQIPFIVKGIMTAEDARECARAGVDGIVVSNHGGRALDSLPGTAEVLPEIAQAVRGKLTVLVDGGIRSGSDILKMLALGADGVLIGRPIAIGAVGGGAEGVRLVLEKFIAELKAAMILTGTAEATDVSPEILWGQL